MKYFLVLLSEIVLALPARAAAPDPKLAQQGYALLKQYCHRCHGIDFKVPRYNVLDRDILLGPRGKGENPYIAPGNPDKSEIWQRLGVEKDMPPKKPKPSPAEVQLLKKWIEAGALFPIDDPRPFKSEKDILTAIRDYLRGNKVEPDDRKFQRFFTLTHLHNNQNVRGDDLRLYRAALAKLVNSLSWEADIVLPQAIDKEGTIFVVDLRRLGWDKHDLWRRILRAYPYGLAYDDSPDKGTRDLAQEISQLTGINLPFLRADWFIAAASRPPLYHDLLELPANARRLEQKLGVDVPKNFRLERLARAALTSSAVSKQNRVVERHPASGGATYYWKSYDFKSNEGRGNLLRFPLGPLFEENPFPNQAFQHAGGEIIFNLPNGLQGYLLVNNKDDRIDEGPVEIVRDANEAAGSPVIVAGLSCMACHKHGLIGGFKDVIRGGNGVSGKARQKVERLYPEKAEMDRLLKKDADRFLQALAEAAGPFLLVGPDKGKDIRTFPEPVGAIAKIYLKDLDLEQVARELDFKDPKDLLTLIKGNARLRALGLGPLLEGASIKRELWESLKDGQREKTNSQFQEAARELDRGTPFRIRR